MGEVSKGNVSGYSFDHMISSFPSLKYNILHRR